MLVTALTPRIGYDAAASVAQEALKTDKSLREVVLARRLMDVSALDSALDAGAMTRRGGLRSTSLTPAVERMENEGVVGQPNHAGKREILMGNEEH